MKLTRDQQYEMFLDYMKTGLSIREMANKYGVSPNAVFSFVQTKLKQAEDMRKYIKLIDRTRRLQKKRGGM